jgi:hypothetical protein
MKKNIYIVLTLITFLFQFSCQSDSSTEFKNQLPSEIKIDFSPLLKQSKLNQTLILITVIDSVILEVQWESGEIKNYSKKFVPNNPVVSFNVDVEPGETTFIARVLSTNRTLLLAGQDTVDIQNDGFEVEIPIQIITPILSVSQDTINLQSGDSDTFFIANAGIGVLEWRIGSHFPPLQSCDGPCLAFFPDTTGAIKSKAIQDIIISTFSFTDGQTTFPIESEVGTINVHVNITLQ